MRGNTAYGSIYERKHYRWDSGNTIGGSMYDRKHNRRVGWVVYEKFQVKSMYERKRRRVGVVYERKLHIYR